jgi:hypothetical protein
MFIVPTFAEAQKLNKAINQHHGCRNKQGKNKTLSTLLPHNEIIYDIKKKRYSIE